MRPFLTPRAIECHILFLGCFAILSYAMLTGDPTWPASEYKLALAFCTVGYAAVLFLLWFLDWNAHREAEKGKQQAPKPAAQVLRQRARWRLLSLVFMYGVGGALIYLGFKGWLLDFLPAQYVGYAFVGFATLGLLGVNIWYNGPIDPRFDPKDNEQLEHEEVGRNMS